MFVCCCYIYFLVASLDAHHHTHTHTHIWMHLLFAPFVLIYTYTTNTTFRYNNLSTHSSPLAIGYKVHASCSLYMSLTSHDADSLPLTFIHTVSSIAHICNTCKTFNILLYKKDMLLFKSQKCQNAKMNYIQNE